jgi:hypothetical protein
MKPIPMQFPYGAVYFRKSNPPKEDWARTMNSRAGRQQHLPPLVHVGEHRGGARQVRLGRLR